MPILHSLDSLHKLVVENGGTFSMNLNSSVTHCIASESKGQSLLSEQSLTLVTLHSKIGINFKKSKVTCASKGMTAEYIE